jgi:hypothetical protein
VSTSYSVRAYPRDACRREARDLIAVVAIAALQLTGKSITGIFNNISNEL